MLRGVSLVASEFLSRPGAVPGVGVDAAVASHYGNPMTEQRMLAAGESVVDLSHRAVLTITGPDRLSWLDSLTSQSLKDLQPGQSSETLLLDPTGHLDYAVRLFDDGVSAWLLLERDESTGLLAWLDRMRFMLRVELANRSADFATIGTLGAAAIEPAAPNGIELIWRDPWVAVTAGGHQYAAVTGHPAAQWTYSEILVPRASTVPGKASGFLALEALRIAAWRPRFATEVDEKTIPHELDWLRSAVHLNKGCYRGQETVAKVHNLGHPPRRLVLLHLDGSDSVLPNPGDEVFVGDAAGSQKAVGFVTSSAQHFELGPIALAVIKRTTAPDAALTVHCESTIVAAAQEIIVPTDAGAEANVPRLPRLGAVQR